MSILFVHERASFTGGVEQNIADSALALRSRGVRCHLAYNPAMAATQIFLHHFDSFYPCSELSTAATILPTRSLMEIASLTRAECIYLHKLPSVPESVLRSPIRSVQMVHDHDLCCPRRHKYFAYNHQVCTRPMGAHCYLDGAFLGRDTTSRFGFRFEDISKKRAEMLRRQRLDLSLVASHFMQQQLVVNGYERERVEVLPLAVREAAPPGNSVPSGTPTILYVGQLIRGKGVDLLLRGMALLRVPFRALIIGKGNAEKDLHKLSHDLGLDYSTEFVGWVNNQDLSRYYDLADIVAVPSRWPEPFGMVGLEGMRHSKPVVAFEVGGIPDWLVHEETGLLVPAADIRAYAAALQRLLVDRRTAAKLGAAGAQHVSREFDFKRYIDRLQDILMPHCDRTHRTQQTEYAYQ